MKLTIRSEWTKFTSSNWCIVGVLIALVLQPILLLVGLRANNTSTPQLALEQILQALYISQVGIVIMSASFFGQEYYDSSLRTTFLANSHRMNVLLAKVLVTSFVAILAGITSSGLGIAVALCHNIYFTSYALGRIAIAVLYWVMIGWISGFIAVVSMSHIISMAIIIPLLLAVNQLLVALWGILRFLPDVATRNVFAVYQNELFLEARVGIVVQFTWVIIMGALAMWLNSRRDVK